MWKIKFQFNVGSSFEVQNKLDLPECHISKYTHTHYKLTFMKIRIYTVSTGYLQD